MWSNEKEEEEEGEEGELDRMCVGRKEDEERRGRAEEAEDSVLSGFRGSCGGSVCLFVAVLCALSFVEGISVNGLPNINISNLEKRFELTSSQAGLISSSGEIGAISFVLFVSFYGGRSHRPRVVAGGGFLLAVGCFFFLLPHFFVEPYTVGLDSDENEGCSSDQHPMNCTSFRVRGSASRLFPLFIVGQALQGIGFTPAFTCGFAYIDDHATPEHTAVYIGVTYAITALGVGVGYVVGGHLLSLWVDIDRADVSQIPITNSDKRWVGAWWIGYAICGVLYIIVSCLMCLFPRYLAGSKTLGVRVKEASLAKPQPEAQRTFFELMLSFPKALFDLMRNPLYILLVLVGLGDALIVSGIAGFAPKIIEEKFNVKPTESGLIMGTVTLMGGAGGMAVGGFLIQKFHLKLRGMIKMCMLFLLFGGVLGGGCFFISCPQQRFAGINSVYSLANHHVPEERDLRAQCNSNCTCATHRFDPICGQDGVTYFSGCYAGCPSNLGRTVHFAEVPTKMYNNCSCIIDSLLDGGRNGNGSAVSGQCAGACPQVWPFVIVLFLGMFFTFLNVTPISMAILRCVPSAERSVGLGLQWVALRLLGTIPGPILTGAVLDTSCLLWQNTCHGRGNCWVYDDKDMSLRLFLLWVVVKVTAITLLGLAHYLYATKGNAVVEENERTGQSMSVPRAHLSHDSKENSSLCHCRGGGLYDEVDDLHLNQLREDGPSTGVDSNNGTQWSTKCHFENVDGRTDQVRKEEPASDCTSGEVDMVRKKAFGADTLAEDSQGVDLQTLTRQAAEGRPKHSSSCMDHCSLSAVRVYPTDPGAGSKNTRTSSYSGNVLSTSL